MSKKFNVITGLPRSGSTLLCNILNQNPAFHASETSALPRLLIEVKKGWENITENVTSNNLEIKKNVLKGIAESYYSHLDKEQIFDKNRAWMGEPELMDIVFQEGNKVIITVRTLNDILASFEKLFRSNNGYFDVTDKKNMGDHFKTLDGRINLWASPNGPVGSTLTQLQEFLLRRNKDVLIIEFDQLTRYPESVIKELYKFLGVDYYEHDFTNVAQTTHEDDRFHGMLGLHNIKQEVKPVTSNARTVLGEALFKKYNGGEFWRTT